MPIAKTGKACLRLFEDALERIGENASIHETLAEISTAYCQIVNAAAESSHLSNDKAKSFFTSHAAILFSTMCK